MEWFILKIGLQGVKEGTSSYEMHPYPRSARGG